MYRKILVPLDGSPRAEAIMPHVTELAWQGKADVLLLQIIAPEAMSAVAYHRPSHLELDNLFKQHAEEASVYLADRQADLQAKGIPCVTFVEYGPIVSTIIEVAAREKVDLIAIASHGRSGLARAMYGSVAAGVLNQVNLPLLIIRASD